MAGNAVRGRFVWHELVTPNSAGAHEFYSKAVGWKTKGWEQDSSYQMFVAPTGPLGATVEKRDAVPTWVAYVGTDDVDATVETAKGLGAKVVTEPTTLPNAGRYATLTDPNGATFGVHGAGGEPQPETDPQIGEFCWHELATTVDPIEAFAFYHELFGWEDLVHHDMGPSGIYLLFGRNGKQVGGMFNKAAAGKPGLAYWLGYVRSNSVDQMTQDVKAARGIVLMEPDAVPGGHRIAQFEDPHGAFFAGQTLAEDVVAAPANKKVAAPKAPRAPKPAKAAAAAPPTANAEQGVVKAPKPAKKKAVKRAVKKAAKKPAKKVAKKPVKKAAKKAAKKATKKAPRKAAKKTGAKKKVAKTKGKKKPAKKSAKAGKRKAKRR